MDKFNYNCYVEYNIELLTYSKKETITESTFELKNIVRNWQPVFSLKHRYHGIKRSISL